MLYSDEDASITFWSSFTASLLRCGLNLNHWKGDRESEMKEARAWPHGTSPTSEGHLCEKRTESSRSLVHARPELVRGRSRIEPTARSESIAAHYLISPCTKPDPFLQPGLWHVPLSSGLRAPTCWLGTSRVNLKKRRVFAVSLS
jgi:hypothetical protein